MPLPISVSHLGQYLFFENVTLGMRRRRGEFARFVLYVQAGPYTAGEHPENCNRTLYVGVVRIIQHGPKQDW